MRHRQRGNIDVSVSTNQERINISPTNGTLWGPWVEYGDPVETYNGSTKQINDVEIPNFKTLKENCKDSRLLPTNYALIESRLIKSTPGWTFHGLYQLDHPRIQSQYRSYFAAPVLSGTERDPRNVNRQSLVSREVNAAVAKAQAALYDLLTELGELSSTVDYFIDTLKRFASLKKSIAKRAADIVKQRSSRNSRRKPKDGRLRRAYTQSDALASAWLEYRYAIMPLVYSLEDIEKALITRYRGIVREKSRADKALHSEHTDYAYSESLGMTTITTTIIDGILTARGSAVMRFDYNEGRVGMDPLITAWELVPMSFVVDWFIDIGSLISSFSPFAEGQLCQSSYSLKYNFTIETVVTRQFKPSGGTVYRAVMYDGQPARTSELIVEYTRSPHPPTFALHLQWDLNWKRYLDSAALVRKLLLSR